MSETTLENQETPSLSLKPYDLARDLRALASSAFHLVLYLDERLPNSMMPDDVGLSQLLSLILQRAKALEEIVLEVDDNPNDWDAVLEFIRTRRAQGKALRAAKS